MKKTLASLFTGALACLIAVPALAGPVATVTQTPFGKTPSGQAVTEYTLKNTHGLQVQILNFGGIIRSISVPDRRGKFADVTLGFDNLKAYTINSPYFGALIGRYGNRIAKGKFSLDGQDYHLPINNAGNTLHGGKVGFNKAVWDSSSFVGDSGVGVKLHHTSPDGDQGFPGNLSVDVTYTLTNDNAIRIEYNATTDADTVLNLTNHAYWNLHGQNRGSILKTIVQINADQFTPTDKTQIPTGEIKNVAGTPFDFRTPTVVGSRIKQKDPQLIIGSGYDHNWVINKPSGAFGLAARAIDPTSGRELSVYTDQPGVQFYTGNFLEGTLPGKGGVIYHKNYGFAFETQHYPDSPNHDNFPSTELKPGDTLHSVTEYRFSIAH